MDMERYNYINSDDIFSSVGLYDLGQRVKAYDVGSTLTQNWVNVSCLLRSSSNWYGFERDTNCRRWRYRNVEVFHCDLEK